MTSGSLSASPFPTSRAGGGGRLALAAVLALAATLSGGCDSGSDGGGSDAASPSGTVTFGHHQGVDFQTGALMDPGTFANSDLYAATNGSSGLNLLPGGQTSANTRAVDWNVLGGVPQTYTSLAAVPDAAPTATATLVNAKTGNGGVVANKAGGRTRVWISSASATSVTLQFEPLE